MHQMAISNVEEPLFRDTRMSYCRCAGGEIQGCYKKVSKKHCSVLATFSSTRFEYNCRKTKYLACVQEVIS